MKFDRRLRPPVGRLMDEGKLLLFIKEQAAEHAPRAGARLAEEKKRKKGEKKLALEDASRAKKRRIASATEAWDTGPGKEDGEG